MTVELDDGRQPRRIGGLAMLVGLGRAVFCVVEGYQSLQHDEEDAASHGWANAFLFSSINRT